LEVRFRRVLGCTLHDYICRERIGRAKRLLGGAERMKLQQVATACGLVTAERLRLVFKRVTGQSPLRYRAAENAARYDSEVRVRDANGSATPGRDVESR
jgi:transcriptional regulator GlxA family with amidase domain